MPKERPTMPEILELPFVCMTCGGQLEIAASERTKKHRRRWLCSCTPIVHMEVHMNKELTWQTALGQLNIYALSASRRPIDNQVCLLLGDKPEDSKIVKLTGEDWQEVHTGAFWSARTGDRFAVLG